MTIHHYSGTTGPTITINKIPDVYEAVDAIHSLMIERGEEQALDQLDKSASQEIVSILSETLELIAVTLGEYGFEVPD